MSSLSEDAGVKISAEAADIFKESYYSALNHFDGRSKLTSFYVKQTPMIKADITLNGAVIEDPAALQRIFEKDVDKAHYEVQSLDCHVLNPNYTNGAPEGKFVSENKDGKNISILVMVSGSVRYSGTSGDGETKGFTDNVVLVPNWHARGPKSAKGDKLWLIQSQTFRVVT